MNVPNDFRGADAQPRPGFEDSTQVAVAAAVDADQKKRCDNCAAVFANEACDVDLTTGTACTTCTFRQRESWQCTVGEVPMRRRPSLLSEHGWDHLRQVCDSCYLAGKMDCSWSWEDVRFRVQACTNCQAGGSICTRDGNPIPLGPGATFVPGLFAVEYDRAADDDSDDDDDMGDADKGPNEATAPGTHGTQTGNPSQHAPLRPLLPASSTGSSTGPGPVSQPTNVLAPRLSKCPECDPGSTREFTARGLKAHITTTHRGGRQSAFQVNVFNSQPQTPVGQAGQVILNQQVHVYQAQQTQPPVSQTQQGRSQAHVPQSQQGQPQAQASDFQAQQFQFQTHVPLSQQGQPQAQAPAFQAHIGQFQAHVPQSEQSQPQAQTPPVLQAQQGQFQAYIPQSLQGQAQTPGPPAQPARPAQPSVFVPRPQLQPQPRPQTYTCEHCDDERTFGPQGMRLHMKALHPNEALPAFGPAPKIQCPYCQGSFQARGLGSHIKHHHPGGQCPDLSRGEW